MKLFDGLFYKKMLGGSGSANNSLVGTWVFKDEINTDKFPHLHIYYFPFVDGYGTRYDFMYINYVGSSSWDIERLFYGDTSDTPSIYVHTNNPDGSYGIEHGWADEHYKTITILEEPTDAEFIEWLRANAIKQPKPLAYHILGVENLPSDAADGSVAILTTPKLNWKMKTYANDSAPVPRGQSVYGIWVLNGNIYSSNFECHRQLIDDEWVDITWGGDSFFEGVSVFVYKGKAYVSAVNSDNVYVLNEETRTWETVDWSIATTTDFDTRHLWSDGNNLYYSHSGMSYVLNEGTDTWEEKTWDHSGDEFNAYNIDGVFIYHHNGNTYLTSGSSFILNGDTWEALNNWPNLPYGMTTGSCFKSINGVLYYFGHRFGTYYETYIFNEETQTWEENTWNKKGINGNNIWTDGTNTYYTEAIGTTYILTELYPIYIRENGEWVSKGEI